jgi:general stress protein YciG
LISKEIQEGFPFNASWTGSPLLFYSRQTNQVMGVLTMAGTKAKYGSDFYAQIGAKGGKLGRTGGFFANRELARAAGSKGGRISRRGSSAATTGKKEA